MSSLSPVVCALDLSAESTSALAAAVDLAARSGGAGSGGALHLVTARPPDGPDVYRAPTDPEAAVRAVVEAYVDRALGTGACARIAPQIAVARDDDAAAALVAYAAEVAAGVLVLGTSGRRGIQRFRLGSVAEEAVRRSRCPVFVVPNRSAGRVPGASAPVLVAVDPDEPDARAIDAAATLAGLFDAPLEAVSVVGRRDVAPARGADAGAPTAAEVALQAHATLDAVHVLSGDPADEIVRLAEARGAGAVVMGTQGLRGVERALFGSVTEAALRRLGCPVLAVRPSA